MTKRLRLFSLVCILFAVIQLTGCVEITVQQPATQQGSTSSDKTLPTKQASSVEGNEVEDDEVPESAEWVEYVADQGGLSFNYPKGWKVEVDESAISIDNAETDEQLIMSMIPFDEDKDPTALATYFITLLQSNNPNLQASNWSTDPQTADSQVVFDLSDEIDNKEYSGSGIVIRDSQQAIWFSYFAPNSTYSNDRSNELLHGFIESLALESAPKDPNINIDSALSAKIDSNAKGFIFVLEFALGAPFTANQEQIILDELKSGWYSLTEEELSNYDQYPLFAKQILTMGQEDLNVLREDLEKTTMEWIDESPDSDKVVNIIRNHLDNKGKVVIDGDPPLTEMSLTAYSEVIAYSRLLRENSEATPEQISSDSVNDIKKQVQDSWGTYTNEEQQQIATSPGIWFCLRTLVNNGSQSEQDDVRSNLLKLTPETQTTGDSNSSNKPMSMAAHNVMMNVQQMTFNTYMWSRGFNYSPAYGKMW